MLSDKNSHSDNSNSVSDFGFVKHSYGLTLRPNLIPVSRLEDWNHLNQTVIGSSLPMRRLKETVLTASGSDSTVLITGETGTGKEVVAKAIHQISERRGGPFLSVNCGALNDSLLESELFGYVKGAFTGAACNKKGLFESANGGTIFLDEFGDMPQAMQVKILRVLQERLVRPVGSSDAREVKVNVRVVVATNKDLKREVDEGRFRADLYYRVNVISLHMPPLRERLEDIPALIECLLLKNSKSSNVKFSRNAIAALSNHDWPGNVRELENALERICVFCSGGDVSLKDVRRNFLSPGITEIEELEMYLYEVRLAGGSYIKAAIKLGMKRTALYMRVKRLKHRCGVT